MATEFLYCWQDKALKFDTKPDELQVRRGEFVIDSINSVEDTKGELLISKSLSTDLLMFPLIKLLISKLIGNNGDRGSLSVTNLRLIWISHRRPNTNLSVGFKSILTLSIRNARSKLRGISQALFLVAKQGTSKYEFVFTSLVKNSPRMFVTVRSVLRAYETTPLYREIKLRLLSIKME